MTDPRRATYVAQVRWSDPDLLGHVNHAKYLSYFEDARMELFASSPSGLVGTDGARGYIAARVAVDYLAPVEFVVGLSLRVETWVARVGTTSWTLRAELFDGDRLVARCEAVMVAYSYGDGTKRPLDADERAFWQGWAA